MSFIEMQKYFKKMYDQKKIMKEKAWTTKNCLALWVFSN